jgi:hypothetical protein
MIAAHGRKAVSNIKEKYDHFKEDITPTGSPRLHAVGAIAGS